MKYIYISIASIIGILVLALKLQGSKLHSLQVKMLAQTIELSNDKDEQLVKTAKSAFVKAMGDYIKSGGKG